MTEKEMVNKLSNTLRNYDAMYSKNHFMEVSNCFKEINELLPNEKWKAMWEKYRDGVYREKDKLNAIGNINYLDRQIYKITGIKTPLDEFFDKLKNIFNEPKRF